jgi:hypothetical protein
MGGVDVIDPRLFTSTHGWTASRSRCFTYWESAPGTHLTGGS